MMMMMMMMWRHYETTLDGHNGYGRSLRRYLPWAVPDRCTAPWHAPRRKPPACPPHQPAPRPPHRPPSALPADGGCRPMNHGGQLTLQSTRRRIKKKHLSGFPATKNKYRHDIRRASGCQVLVWWEVPGHCFDMIVVSVTLHTNCTRTDLNPFSSVSHYIKAC